jgi:hypothetical protein
VTTDLRFVMIHLGFLIVDPAYRIIFCQQEADGLEYL